MAHVTDLGFDLEELGVAIEDGDVRFQRHPEFPYLHIFNYTEDVQYRNRWNKITLACRGLILDTRDGSVVARPWEKFFNLGQRDNEIDAMAPVEVTDKKDGSLGILYLRPDNKWAIATRGSFASEQAIHATALLSDKYGYVFDYETGLGGPLDNTFANMVRNWTYLFEIVYPDNRIVVNYGDLDDLILLGAVNKEYGYYQGPATAAAMACWDGPVTEVFHFNHFVETLSAPDRIGAEGYVIRSGNKMVKLKQADYVELHRIVTNLSPKTIWEMLGNGRMISEICAQIPDEFHSYVEDIGNTLLRQAGDIVLETNIAFGDILVALGDSNPPRRKFAELATKHKHKALLFMLLDNKQIFETAWRMVKPRGDVKTLVKDEG